jgi:replicative DNA helicase
MMSPDNTRVDVEGGLLGVLLLSREAIDDAADKVSVKDFALEVHRRIYQAITFLAERGEKVDVFTVEERLRHTGELNESCDRRYLVKMASCPCATKNAKAYAEIVHNLAIERGLLATASAIPEIVYGEGETREKLEKAQGLLAGIADERSEGPKLAKELLSEFVDELDKRFHRDGKITGLPTGFLDLDEKTNGLQPGDLVIVAGRPGTGKSTLAQNLAENAFLSGKSVLLFSLEMSNDQVINRSVSSIGRIPFGEIRSGKLSDESWAQVTNSVSRLTATKFHIDDQSSLTVGEIGARARRVKRQHGLDLVIVDYLQLLGGEGENETLRITAISRALKILAKDLGVPVIALSQLNRSLESRTNKRPIMSDLRQSGSLEQDADLILFIYRDEIYNENSPHKGLAELIIGKQRNGPVGMVGLTFRGDFCRFENFAGDWPKEEKVVPMRQRHSRGIDI